MAWTPIKLRSGGDVRFVGEAEGAGTAPVQAVYIGLTTSVDDGAGATPLHWDALDSGTALVNLADDPHPSFLAAGTYAITAYVYSDPLTAGGWCQLSIGDLAVTSAITTDHPDAAVSVTLPAVEAAAGDSVVIFASLFDGVSARNFTLANVLLVKLA